MSGRLDQSLSSSGVSTTQNSFPSDRLSSERATSSPRGASPCPQALDAEGGGIPASSSASFSVAQQITDLVLYRQARGEEIRILGITGPPGTGKTTVAALVAGMLESAGVEVAGLAPMDGFHLSNALLEEWDRHERKGAPDTFDVWGYVSLLQRIQASTETQFLSDSPAHTPFAEANAPVLAPDYRRDLHEAVAASIPLAPRGIVITEGNYLGLDQPGWREARQLIDLLIFIDTEEADIYRRLLARHEAFGKESAEAAHWVRTVDAANVELVNSCRPRADAVICSARHDSSGIFSQAESAYDGLKPLGN